MPWFVYPFGSGAVFFFGVALVIICLFVFARSERRWAKVLATWIALIGFISIAASSTPLPYWLYGLGAAITIPWLIAERMRSSRLSRGRIGLRWAVGALWAVAAAIELPHHFAPTLAVVGRPPIYIIGDSISAGTISREQPWPAVLAQKHSIEVLNLSSAGAGVVSALRQASQLPLTGGLVVLEIGGNDLLDGTSAGQFEQGLNSLLSDVCVPGHTVLMFELPLPPFCNGYGQAQRTLAERYHVLLIPKRVLLAQLMGDDATSDSLHLTSVGHERLADAVWTIIRGAYGE